MKKVFQLWGLEPAQGLDEQQVLSRLDEILSVQPFAVVAGQTQNKALLRAICEKAHKAGTRVHQWASVFSENDDAADWDPFLLPDGSPFPRLFGEHFYFRCPGSEKNVELFIQLQKKAMADVPFDGVFLDRIRYPSLAGGATDCHCPVCQKDKTQNITRAVQTLKDAFGEVSLDLFPPCLAGDVGQDLQQLAPLAAFIKPMLYLYTTAPAGLPFELAAYPNPPDPLDGVSQWHEICPDLYWGIEGGRGPGVVDTNPERIQKALSLLPPGANVCASWASISFPRENLDAFLLA